MREWERLFLVRWNQNQVRYCQLCEHSIILRLITEFELLNACLSMNVER